MAAGTDPPDLEERVAALEEMLANPSRWFILPSWQPLTPEQVRYLLRECVTVVKPGEVLVIRVGFGALTPLQVRELQDAVDDMREYRDLPVKILVLPGDELAVAEPEP